MSHARLQRDVDMTEEAELRRLEGRHGDATGDARGSSPFAAAHASGQPAATAHATSRGGMEGGGGQTEAREALVTGYAEKKRDLTVS